MNHQKHPPQDRYASGLNLYSISMIAYVFIGYFISPLLSFCLCLIKPERQIYMALDELVVCFCVYFIHDLEFSIGGHIKVYECKRIMYTVI